jgi:predicted RNA binding protein YcfA (HicA-like mRNA interferase family)
VSSSLPQVFGQKVVRALEAAGFEHTSTRGSHAKLRHPDGRVVIVPLHRTLARGTLGSILRQAGLTAAQFVDLLG